MVGPIVESPINVYNIQAATVHIGDNDTVVYVYVALHCFKLIVHFEYSLTSDVDYIATYIHG